MLQRSDEQLYAHSCSSPLRYADFIRLPASTLESRRRCRPAESRPQFTLPIATRGAPRGACHLPHLFIDFPPQQASSMMAQTFIAGPHDFGQDFAD